MIVVIYVPIFTPTVPGVEQDAEDVVLVTDETVDDIVHVPVLDCENKKFDGTVTITYIEVAIVV